MNTANNITLAASTDTGNTGIYHLKRIWSKATAGQDVTNQYPEETMLDNALIDILGIGLLPTYQYLYGQKPDFESFEKWVMAFSNGIIDEKIVQQCNALFLNKKKTEEIFTADVLTPADIVFWEKHGYVIIKNAVSTQDCAASRKAIINHLEMDENDAATWYKESEKMQGIMVPLYRDDAIDKNRNSAKIRRAFEQLWNRTDLIVTTDKCGFNPPETEMYNYKGIGLHWDVSLARPIPFGTQGILYLTDTAANQGALTVVPGFHKIIENWLTELPQNVNPREADFNPFAQKSIAANAGDFIIWNHKLPHSSSPNKAALPRIVQYINWYAPLQKIQQQWI
jgi:hypothetical protein